MILPGDSPAVHVVKNGSRGYQLYYVDPITEKRVWRTARTTSEKEAHKAAGQWETELQTQRPTSNARATWDQFRVIYRAEKLLAQAQNSRVAAESSLNTIERIIDPARPANITSSCLSRFANQLRQEGKSETTIHSYLRDVMIALRWGSARGLVPHLPSPPPTRASKSRGRPITTEEFDRLLAAVAKEPQCTAAPQQWEWYLRGLWWSGLRLAESHRLSWEETESFAIFAVDGNWYFRIWSDGQKNRRDDLLPVAPEFGEMLHAVPKAQRTGPVFCSLGPKGEQYTSPRVGRVISAIGERAQIRTTPKGYCTAHDLRRSFGTRWARRVKPVTLQKLMRHKSILTTMDYYVQLEAIDLQTEINQAFINATINAEQNSPHVETPTKSRTP